MPRYRFVLEIDTDRPLMNAEEGRRIAAFIERDIESDGSQDHMFDRLEIDDLVLTKVVVLQPDEIK